VISLFNIFLGISWILWYYSIVMIEVGSGIKLKLNNDFILIDSDLFVVIN